MDRVNKILGHLSPNRCSASKQAYARHAELMTWDISNPDEILYLNTITDTDKIKSVLSAKGVGFDVWPQKRITGSESNDEILYLYREQIEAIKQREGLHIVDIVNVTKETQKKVRSTFWTEHIHPTKEVRLYVSGCLFYYIHLEDEQQVMRIVTPPGCLIVLPDKAKHWADIGDRADLTVIRFFGQQEGYSAKYTQSGLDDKFPRQSPL